MGASFLETLGKDSLEMTSVGVKVQKHAECAMHRQGIVTSSDLPNENQLIKKENWFLLFQPKKTVERRSRGKIK